jgi:hypothetical protein
MASVRKGCPKGGSLVASERGRLEVKARARVDEIEVVQLQWNVIAVHVDQIQVGVEVLIKPDRRAWQPRCNPDRVQETTH